MKLRKHKVGNIRFDGKIDITDPCYSRDVWCRMNGIEVKAGEYEAAIWTGDNAVGILGIYFNGIVPDQNKMEYLGEIGVDAGVAGFVRAGTELNREEWNKFCDMTSKSKKDAWILDWGIVSSSGYGDGSYDVFSYKLNDEITAVEIRFF